MRAIRQSATIARARVLHRLARSHGFALPVAIFVLVLMSIVAVAALWASDNERRSDRAMRSGSASFDAAEAGLEQQWGTWSDSVAKTLRPGESVGFGAKTLENGSSYHVVMHRVDNGGTPIFEMVSEGRGAPRYGGESLLNYFVERTVIPNTIVAAAIRGEGTTELQSPFKISGFDSVPPQWGATS